MNIDTLPIDKILKDIDEVGKMILSYYEGSFNVEIKDDETPVTCADISADKLIREYLLQYTPTIPIISEEEAIPAYNDRKDYEYFWIVDPLDGTKEFINKTDEFAINIALIHNRKPVVAFIHLPVFKETYFAVKSKGTKVYKDGKISEIPKECTDKRVALVSRSHKDDEALAMIEDIEQKNSFTFSKQVLGSSHKQIAIINNVADIYVKLSAGPQEWDFAAGQLLIEESGGDIIDLTTKEAPVYNKECLKMSGFIMRSRCFRENYTSL